MGSRPTTANPSDVAPDQPRDPVADRQATLGLVFLLLLGIGLLFAVWLARVQFARDYATYDVQLVGQVQGLARGGAVYINGVRTGEVTRLAIDETDPSRVVARIRVSADAPVRKDSTAALEWLGVSGTRIIQLSGGTLSTPLLRQAALGGVIPVIHAAPGAFDRNNPEGKSAAAQALDALDALNQRLSDRNLAVIGGSLAAARTTAATWRVNAKALGAMDGQLVESARLADQLARSAESMNGQVNGDLRRQLARLAQTSADAKGSIERARAGIVGMGTTAEARAQALPAITSGIAQAGALVERAGQVVERLDSQQPQILGPPAAQELKVAP